MNFYKTYKAACLFIKLLYFTLYLSHFEMKFHINLMYMNLLLYSDIYKPYLCHMANLDPSVLYGPYWTLCQLLTVHNSNMHLKSGKYKMVCHLHFCSGRYVRAITLLIVHDTIYYSCVINRYKTV